MKASLEDRERFARAVEPVDERSERIRRSANRATAELWDYIGDEIAEARETPWVWTSIPDGETSPRAREMAERAIAMELAARLRLSEMAVRRIGHIVAEARDRLPGVWGLCAAYGNTSPEHVRALLEVSRHLTREQMIEFGARTIGLVYDLPVGRMRARAKVIAESIRSTPLEERRKEAQERRGVWVDQVDDGMAWLTALLPAQVVHRAKARLDVAAAELASHDDETRTRDQLRADIAADLLTGDGTPHAVKATVNVTVPVLSLLGKDDAPALLDGIVPVDPAVARELCAEAPSFFRILTDPVTSAIKDLDRRVYRPPADLARFVRLRDRVCVCAGCMRPAAGADLDHSLDWAKGGPTSAANLASLCTSHHPVKHASRFIVRGSHGRLTWTSPRGYVIHPEPDDPLYPPGYFDPDPPPESVETVDVVASSSNALPEDPPF